MKVVFHEDFYRAYTADPAAEEGRVEAVVEVIGPHVEFVDASPARIEDIEAVHTKDHIERVKRMGLHEIASLAAGGAIRAATIGLVEPCFGLIRPPGHHASSDSSWGFCYYNNMAIALEHLKNSGKIDTAFILDFDLHYGDGTVNILGGKNYVTIFNPQAHDRLSYMNEVMDEVDRCTADMIAVSAGFDNHIQDWGGTLATGDYQEMGRAVREASVRNRGGCFAVLEGGYNQRVLGHNVLALIKGLSGQ
ncbi:MAG: histone deacetylase family protein [Bacteriovoracaceae bacterium]|jgi:acetoin utilization deacetylase AcuC-like enzyme|nr:histone deacetylase family protein [Pseudomonadota bacterium]NLW67693.1 histone deacetylase family protein [Bacteriovoracaceae bacterium]HQA71140.1 histone deacetylase family protein [Deltaproteobacteria bacterium]HRR19811.1 histone deacetylase family protein [Desulfomonilia bacterium]HRR67689.1 histone deacetylase family protein [Desulfomonilia bacterium]